MRKEEMENVVEEIKEQDLDNQAAGVSMMMEQRAVMTAIQLSISGKCGSVFTISYECTTNNIRCR